MIKFFRKIRRRLLSENKFSKYLLYAIGEIFLVVIGILIAVQINNWNTYKKNMVQELIYINSFREDLKTDIVNSYEVLSKLNNRIRGIDSLLQVLSSKEVYNHSNEAYKLWVGHLGFPNFVSNDRTLILLKNGNGFEFIKNTQVTNAILAYEKTVKKFELQHNVMMEIITNEMLYPKAFDIIRLESSAIDKSSIPLMIQDKRTVNELYGNRGIWKMGLIELEKLLVQVNEEGKRTIKLISEQYKLSND